MSPEGEDHVKGQPSLGCQRNSLRPLNPLASRRSLRAAASRHFCALQGKGLSKINCALGGYPPGTLIREGCQWHGPPRSRRCGSPLPSRSRVVPVACVWHGPATPGDRGGTSAPRVHGGGSAGPCVKARANARVVGAVARPCACVGGGGRQSLSPLSCPLSARVATARARPPHRAA